MKSLNYVELSKMCNTLNTTLEGNHIPNVVLINSSDILLTFSYYRKEKLLISLNHNAPFISLVDGSVAVSTLQNKLCEELRKYVKDTILTNIKTLNNDRIAEISLQKTDDFYEKHIYYLILELIPRSPNLLLLDQDRKIIFATHYTSLESKRVILKNFIYEVPESHQIDAKIEVDFEKYKIEANEYIIESMKNRNKEKFDKLISTIKRKIKTAKHKEEVLTTEIEDAKEALIYKDHGNMLLTLKYDEHELNNYIHECNVPYDNTKDVTTNINNLFKKYKKAKTTIELDKEQLLLNEENIAKLEKDLKDLEDGDEALYILLSSLYLKTSVPKHEVNKLTPYFTTIDGTKIGFGRNASQNDLLTFKKAKDEHYFLHVMNVHGSHVIIFKPNPSDNDKENAAMLALLLSNMETGSVQIAKVKDIKKGQFPGQVLMNKYSEIKINNIKDKVRKSLEKAKRVTF